MILKYKKNYFEIDKKMTYLSIYQRKLFLKKNNIEIYISILI